MANYSINSLKKYRKQHGFTLIELVVVIILLGVTSVGIAQLLSLGTQSYVNSVERDQLSHSARFAIERLNREIPEALPNSIRNFSVADNGNIIECIEFVPIVAGSHYVNLTNSNAVDVIHFNLSDGASGLCNDSCGLAAIYTLSADDIYVDTTQVSGQIFPIRDITETTTTDVWRVAFNDSVNFNVLSPSERIYIVNQPVRYCVDNTNLLRVSNYNITQNLTASAYPTGASSILMAENISRVNFTIQEASLTRNAVVQIDMVFQSSLDSSEQISFSHEVAVLNTP